MPASHCVIIPFYNRVEQVSGCLSSLLAQALPDSSFLLINDASTDPLEPLLPLLSADNVHLLTHPENAGVSAARNTALHWCRNQGIEVVIMIDSDCLPDAQFIEKHLQLHAEHPQAACIGAAIVGYGDTFWSRVDGVTSWVHAAPHYPLHNVEHPYHLPTTNFSVKTTLLPAGDFVFDERLYTGEDCLLIRTYRAQGKQVLFSPEPTIAHRDRDRLIDVIRHHYKWGHHQYFVQLGRDVSDFVFNPLYRCLFFLLFLPLWPLYAAAGAFLNVAPWLRRSPAKVFYAPFVYGLWLLKGIAVMEAAIRPRAVMRRPRVQIEYVEHAGSK